MLILKPGVGRVFDDGLASGVMPRWPDVSQWQLEV